MLNKFLEFFRLACGHRRMSKPFTSSAGVMTRSDHWDVPGAATTHYVVCLECGRKFDYDWSQMRVVR